jgi:ureidoglycolate lyase
VVHQIVQLDGIAITARPLSPEAFAPFGDVIQNPRPALIPSTLAPGAKNSAAAASLPPNAEVANQGFAIKYNHVTRPVNLYDQAPSRTPAAAVASMFVSEARELEPNGRDSENDVFAVKILERHPFTTQTFVPLSSHPGTLFLVVVAPTLPSSSPVDENLPIPQEAGTAGGNGSVLRGSGLPNLQHLQAFIATSDQAVSYGAGTWHAPMITLGPRGSAISFVVFQSANGVPVEDCQEVTIIAGDTSPSVTVRVPKPLKMAKL